MNIKAKTLWCSVASQENQLPSITSLFDVSTNQVNLRSWRRLKADPFFYRVNTQSSN